MSKKGEIEMTDYFDVLEDVKKCIANSQYSAMISANVERNILYWNIGKLKETELESELVQQVTKLLQNMPLKM